MHKFEIPLRPEPLSRPRVCFHTKRVYQPKKDKIFQNRIHYWVKNNWERKEPIQGPVVLHVEFHVLKPKTVKRRYPHVKPDLDNLVKNVLDGLNGILFKDDAQVIGMITSKRYAKEEKVVIEAKEVE